MQKNIFAHTAPGASYPEFLSINEQDDGRITVCVRGPKKMHTGAAADYEGPGETVDMTLPRDKVAELIQSLLALPPVDEVREAKPLVLYFATEADREECIAAIQEVKPNMRAVRV